jgi:tripartite-type tricarboxylate transporter receptor subunit TctC
MRRQCFVKGFLVVLFAHLIVPPGTLFSQADFFQGKTITIIQGRDPDGTGDMRVRAMIPFLQKYTPGNPNIVSEYMPGGGGRKAANHVYRSARPDGLTIGNPGVGMVSSAVLGETGVLYEHDKFFCLGSPYSTYHPIFVSRKEAGLNNLVAGGPSVLPPGTPKDRVNVLQEAFRKTYKDPEFLREYKKLVGDEPTPLLPENHEKAIREIPRDPEAIGLYKKLVGAEPLPLR